MNVLLSFFVFFLGAAVGSFLNVVIIRYHREEQFVRGRSRCPHCRTTLPWYELVPIASFIVLAGRCRRCNARLSRQYILVELATGLLFLIGWLYLPLDLTLALYLLSAVVFVLLFVYDLKYYIVPDTVSLPATVAILILNLARGANLVDLLIAMILGGGWFLVQFLLSKGKWVGGGDIRLGVLMGATLSFPLIILALMLSYIGGSIIALALLALGRKQLGSRLPFATMLLPSTLIVFLWGNTIWGWYLGLLGF